MSLLCEFRLKMGGSRAIQREKKFTAEDAEDAENIEEKEERRGTCVGQFTGRFANRPARSRRMWALCA